MEEPFKPETWQPWTCLSSLSPGLQWRWWQSFTVSTFPGAELLVLFVLFFPEQEEMRRIEEEQSFEELKILRELVHERFHKQEELAEVRNSV